MWDTVKRSNIHVVTAPEEQERENKAEAASEEITDQRSTGIKSFQQLSSLTAPVHLCAPQMGKPAREPACYPLWHW